MAECPAGFPARDTTRGTGKANGDREEGGGHGAWGITAVVVLVAIVNRASFAVAILEVAGAQAKAWLGGAGW